MTTPSERAQQRRETWTGAVVPAGSRKPLLYAELPLAERLAAFTALNDRVWRAAGVLPLAPLDRDQWPGSIIRPATSE